MSELITVSWPGSRHFMSELISGSCMDMLPQKLSLSAVLACYLRSEHCQLARHVTPELISQLAGHHRQQDGHFTLELITVS